MTDLYVNQSDHIGFNNDVFRYNQKSFVFFFLLLNLTLERLVVEKSKLFYMVELRKVNTCQKEVMKQIEFSFSL